MRFVTKQEKRKKPTKWSPTKDAEWYRQASLAYAVKTVAADPKIRETKDRAVYKKAKHCTSKKPFTSEMLALRAHKNQKPYKCTICKGWHLTAPLYGAVEPGLWREVYQRYLLSDEWKQKRLEVFAKYGCRCQRCPSNRDLEVHHKTYKRVGSERMSDLEVLCHECHAKHHGVPA